MFVIYYNFDTWVLCNEDGTLISVGASEYSMNKKLHEIASTVVWC